MVLYYSTVISVVHLLGSATSVLKLIHYTPFHLTSSEVKSYRFPCF